PAPVSQGRCLGRTGAARRRHRATARLRRLPGLCARRRRQGGDVRRGRPQAVGSRAVQDRRRGGRRAVPRSGRDPDDLLRPRARPERPPARRGAGADRRTVNRVAAAAALAIHPGALGDVLLAIPALRALRSGGTRVTLAAQPRIAALITAIGEADAAQNFEALRLDALFSGIGDARLPSVDRLVCWFGARDPDFTRRLSALVPNTVVAPSTSPESDVWEHLLTSVGGRAERRPAAVGDDLVAQGHAVLAGAG